MNSPAHHAYSSLQSRARETALIQSATATLGWDAETALPPAAVPYRAEQEAHLAAHAHRLATAPEVGAWLDTLEDHPSSDDPDAAAQTREWRRDYNRATKIPASLVADIKRESAIARDAWASARATSNFTAFLPHLQCLLDLNRRAADLWGFDESPYDALLEEHEPGARASTLAPMFDSLRQAIAHILPHAAQRSAISPTHAIRGPAPIPAQEAFNHKVAAALGFDFNAGHLAASTHPFCTELGPRDVRMTTRFDPDDFTASLFSVLHETGHALYSQGLPHTLFGTPLGSASSLGIHESQSRLWENLVGRSRPFWEHWFPQAQAAFPHLRAVPLDGFLDAVNRVRPSLIRTDSDEVTYNLHIILRFDLEKLMVEGALHPRDLPEAWDARFAQLLGLHVPDPASGCLQDIHWAHGAFGYFPTYTLGNLNAAQLMAAARADIPDLDAQTRAGCHSHLLGWLRDKIHRHGRRHPPAELIRLATGHLPHPTPFIQHLAARFGTPAL